MLLSPGWHVVASTSAAWPETPPNNGAVSSGLVDAREGPKTPPVRDVHHDDDPDDDDSSPSCSAEEGRSPTTAVEACEMGRRSWGICEEEEEGEGEDGLGGAVIVGWLYKWEVRGRKVRGER